MPPFFLLIQPEQVTSAFFSQFTDKICLINYPKILEKYLFRHHFHTEEEKAKNCVMPLAALAPLMICLYSPHLNRCYSSYVDIYLGLELTILFQIIDLLNWIIYFRQYVRVVATIVSTILHIAMIEQWYRRFYRFQT